MSRFVQMPIISGGTQTGVSRDIVIRDIPRPRSSNIETKADMMHAVCYATAQIVDGKIYVFGGRASTDPIGSTYVQIYDIATNVWTSGTDVPYAIDGATSFVHGRDIYIVGGEANTSHMSRYNIDENAWHNEIDPPYVFQCAYGTLHETQKNFYLAGGISGGYVLKKAAFYNIESKTWSLLPDMPTACANGFGFIDPVDNCFFCYFNQNRVSAKYLFDKQMWVKDTNTAYVAPACVFVDGHLFKIGGEQWANNKPWNLSNLVTSYFPVSTFFTTDFITRLPKPVMAACAIWYEGLIYVIGGKSRKPDTPFADVYTYKPRYEEQGFLCRGECEVEVDRRALVKGNYISPNTVTRVNGIWSLVFPDGVGRARITPLSDDFEICGTRG